MIYIIKDKKQKNDCIGYIICAKTRVCHLKRSKSRILIPAFIDKLGIIGCKSSFKTFEIYIPTFIYLYENFNICFYVF